MIYEYYTLFTLLLRGGLYHILDSFGKNMKSLRLQLSFRLGLKELT